MRALFMEKLDVDEEVADILIAGRLLARWRRSPTCRSTRCSRSRRFDENTVNELRSRARDALLVQAIASEEKRRGRRPRTCSSSRAWTRELAAKLGGQGIKTRDDLADLAVDDLVEMTGMDAERAKALIMKARAHWFAQEGE